MGLKLRVWHWGDGETSNGISPTHTYKYPGTYEQSYIDYFDDGSEIETVVGTTTISETNSNSQHNVNLYDSDNRKCLRLSIHGDESGWSYLDGDRWLWPESSAGICSFAKDGIIHKIIWDNNGYAYVYNLRDSSVDSINTSFTDKFSDISGLENPGFDISSSIKFKEMRGNNSHYKIKHEETFFKIRPEDSETAIDPSINVSLYVDGEDSGVTTQYNIDEDNEVLFDYKKDGDTFQLEISLDKSNWELLRYETYSSVTDRSRISSNNNTFNNNAQLNLSDLSYWMTRPNYNVDRVTGDDIGYYGFVAHEFESVDGPDGRSDSAIRSVVEGYITHPIGGGNIMSFWTDNVPAISGQFPLGLTTFNTIGSFSLCYGQMLSNEFTFPEAVSFYDIRGMNSTDANYEDYLLIYYNDILNNSGDLFLPRF